MPQSRQIQVREEFVLSDVQSRMDYHMTIVDPAIMTGPGTHDLYSLALGAELQYYGCVPQ